jgi:hypothetical protein
MSEPFALSNHAIEHFIDRLERVRNQGDTPANRWELECLLTEIELKLSDSQSLTSPENDAAAVDRVYGRINRHATEHRTTNPLVLGSTGMTPDYSQTSTSSGGERDYTITFDKRIDVVRQFLERQLVEVQRTSLPNLAMREHRVLYFLIWNNQPTTQLDVKNFLNMSASTVTDTIRELDQRGIIERLDKGGVSVRREYKNCALKCPNKDRGLYSSESE